MASRYQQSARTAARILDGQAFVITPDYKLHTLNATGTRIWELTKEPTALDALATAIAERFDVEVARARADAQHFCDALVARQALEVIP